MTESSRLHSAAIPRFDELVLLELVALDDVVFSDDGVAAGEPVECLSANAAVMRAEALSRRPGQAGAIAFSRTGDPSSGDFSDAKLIRKFGEVPEDLSAL